MAITLNPANNKRVPVPTTELVGEGRVAVSIEPGIIDHSPTGEWSV